MPDPRSSVLEAHNALLCCGDVELFFLHSPEIIIRMVFHPGSRWELGLRDRRRFGNILLVSIAKSFPIHLLKSSKYLVRALWFLVPCGTPRPWGNLPRYLPWSPLGIPRGNPLGEPLGDAPGESPRAQGIPRDPGGIP